MHATDRTRAPWRTRLYTIIFESDTRAGRDFDVLLFALIVGSVLAVLLESVAEIRARAGHGLRAAEWVFTAAFTAEYILRLLSAPRPGRYARSFLGVVDLLAVVPTYLSLLFAGTQALIVLRALRLLRVFRVLKLGRYVREAIVLQQAMRASARKILVFLGTVLTLVLIIGALIHLIEGPERGFTSIPFSIYWAVVTLTTVGYGDAVPQTVLGHILASIVMITGYSIIAVPTGIVTVELAGVRRRSIATQGCPSCERLGHDTDARHCKYCGSALED